MSTPAPLGFFARFGLAFSLFFKVLFDGVFAGRASRLNLPEPSVVPPQAAPPPKAKEPPAAPAVVPEASVLQLLSAFQREGRFLDFVKEDVANVPDGDLAGVARLVHSGCRRVVDGWFTIDSVWPGEEGAKAVVQPGFDGRRIRLTGNVTGEPPFTGTLTHHGWRASATRLPTVAASADPTLLAPAEIEL